MNRKDATQKAGQGPETGASPDPAAHEDRQSVAVSALIFAFGTALSRVLGLFRDMLTARYFSHDVRDAFLNAFRLPNLFRRIFGEGSLSVSFIPVFVEILTSRPQEPATDRARALVAGIFSILLSVTLTLSLLAIVFMSDLMRFLLNGQVYMAVPGKFELTVTLGRIMFGFLILISLYGYFMAILNSLRKFAMTALAPCFFNISMITAALVSPRLAAPEIVLAISVLVGGAVQMAVLVPQLLKSGYAPRFTLQWASPDIFRVLKALGPSLFGVSILQITALVNMRFAADLPSGSHSYLYLADRILELPLSLFVVSIGSALLPTLARFWAAQDRQAMSDTINHYIRLIIFVALPAAIGMFVLARQISEVLFIGREFKYADALATASVIRVYSFLVVLVAGVRILSQGFYAIQNTSFPAVAAGVALVAHVAFAWALTPAFGLEGLAAASVAGGTVNLVMLATAYNAWVGKLEFRQLFKSLARFALCAAVMIGALQVFAPVYSLVAGKFWGSRATVLFSTIGFAACAYFLAARLLKCEEYEETVETFRLRLKKRFGRLN